MVKNEGKEMESVIPLTSASKEVPLLFWGLPVRETSGWFPLAAVPTLPQRLTVLTQSGKLEAAYFLEAAKQSGRGNMHHLCKVEYFAP